MERRFHSCPVRLETRADGKKVIAGYGAVFYDPNDPGTEYQLYSDLRERIMPTAFDRAIREKQDCRGLFNHDPNMVLGRCSAGTMSFSADQRGLPYEILPGDTTCARDVCEHIQRGDVTGSSFSFSVAKQAFVQEGDSGMDIREIHDVDLYDAGPVTFPAYESTTAGMRSLSDLAEVRSAYESWRNERAASRGRVTFVLASYSALARAAEVDAAR